MTQARILSFHIDDHELPGLNRALDGVAKMFADHADFRGLVCLAHDGPRNEIMVMTLWDGNGLEETEQQAEIARQRIAATTDLGVSSKSYEVVRIVPGSAALEKVIASAELPADVGALAGGVPRGGVE